MPVHLGLVDVAGGVGYFLPGGARVVHMMLMSWCGEPVGNFQSANLAAKMEGSANAVWNEGVVHGDLRQANMLWNEERQRVRIVDFGQATFRAPPRHKQLSILSSRKKRKRQGRCWEAQHHR